MKIWGLHLHSRNYKDVKYTFEQIRNNSIMIGWRIFQVEFSVWYKNVCNAHCALSADQPLFPKFWNWMWNLEFWTELVIWLKNVCVCVLPTVNLPGYDSHTGLSTPPTWFCLLTQFDVLNINGQIFITMSLQRHCQFVDRTHTYFVWHQRWSPARIFNVRILRAAVSILQFEPVWFCCIIGWK